jgi:V/A-type H+-transporting ATPase subunit A
MPVAAREASIYTGITIAEYYRDMGYDVLMLADSTSRWGEALREISSRLEEIPGEEGYPAYMATRLSEFYERTGRVSCLGSSTSEADGASRSGSITLVGAVSPAGGDFSEPITQSSMRIAGVFWALDYTLSRRRHFPAINWIQSYSLFDFSPWYHDHLAADYPELVSRALNILRREDELQKIVELVGHDALSETEQETLMIARMIREDLLQQSAMHEIDRYCPMDKSYRMLKTLLIFHDLARKALQNGIGLPQINSLVVLPDIARMKEIPNNQVDAEMDILFQKIAVEFRRLGVVA